MARLLLAKEVNAALNSRTADRAAALKERGIIPALAIVRVGCREEDLAYERGAEKRCAALGIEVKHVTYPETVDTEEMISVIEALNQDDQIHGVLIMNPLPAHLDGHRICNALLPGKDVDGVTDISAGGLYIRSGIGYAPCTAGAVMEILHYYDINTEGKRVAVIGRSKVIGKPVAMMLLGENATVTICHSRTGNLAGICRESDIVVAAAGRARMIDADYAAPGQVIIDVGIHMGEDGKLCGDVDYEAVSPIVSAITPVPGGVGGVTTGILAAHAVEAAEALTANKEI